MNEADLTETLDRRGQLDAARGPGCYALEVEQPATVQQAINWWRNVRDVNPPNDALARIATAESILYVGAASNVYERLCDHVAADVRRAAFLSAFPVKSLHSLWPKDSAEVAFREETAVARALAGPERRVWTDGVLL